MKTDRKLVEKALEALCMDNPKRAKALLVKALGLVEMKKERKCSYTWRRPK